MRVSNGLQLGLFFAVMVVPLTLAVTVDAESNFGQIIFSEHGFVENATILFAAFGLWYAVRATRVSFGKSSPLSIIFCIVMAIGFFYIITEESSWGQHWVEWETPAWLSDVNRYGEANLHNISYEADRIPKSIVGAFIVIFGIGIPLLSRRLPRAFTVVPLWIRDLLPTWESAPIAMMFLAMWVANRTIAWLDLRAFNGRGFASAEHLEMIMVAFLFLYALCLSRSLGRQPRYEELGG